MDTLKKLFPYSFNAEDVASLVIKIIVYLVVGAIAGFVIGIFGKLPLIGIIASLVGALAEIYILAGIIIAVLDFLKVLK